MIHKKICLLGAPCVGKTSLVRQFVSNKFSETYLTTIGVKIERKKVKTPKTDLNLLIWDIHGEDEFLNIDSSFLQGAAGFLMVVDSERPETAALVGDLRKQLIGADNLCPIVVAANKVDLIESPDAVLESLTVHIGDLASETVLTSAKTGQGVEKTFSLLAEKIV